MNPFKELLRYVHPYRVEFSVGIIALVLTDIIGLVIPWLVKNVIDLLPDKPDSGTLLFYAGVLFIAAGFQGLFRFGWRKYMFGPSRKVEFDILNGLFQHFLTLDRFFYLNRKVGDLMSRATNDIRSVREFVGLGVLVLIDCVVVIISCFSLMLYIHPKIFLYCILPLPTVSFLFYWFYKTVSVQHRVVQEKLSEISELVQENLSGIRVLHAYVQEEIEQRKFDGMNRSYLNENMKLTRISGAFSPSLGFVAGISALIALWFGGKAVISGEMTVGSFVAFNSYLMMLSWPMMGIGFVFNLSQKGLVALSRLNEIMESETKIKNEPVGKDVLKIHGTVEFNRVSFSYDKKSEFGIRDLNLKIPSETLMAFIGPIGSGKSTVAQLILRLFDPDQGSVLLDGKDIRNLPLGQLRSQIGFVNQTPYLFSASIKQNIYLASETASDNEIREVSHIAGLEPDLESFPNGLETLVGERGVSLSGGQKQRIALARALIRRPKILILDDAFSNLDLETEGKVLKNIRQYIHGMTTILITHRLSTIRNADDIVVFNKGYIMEKGNHKALIAHSGYYEKVFNDQMLAREMELLME